MRVRSIVAGLATTAVAASVTGLATMAPAHADPSYGTPDANDIVGVGSDTTENAMDNLSNGISGTPGYNAGLTAGDVRLASFDTVGSATIVLRSGSSAITRPVGSGAGKALLYGAGNNTDVTFARSSSALNATEVSANLQAFPFALDTLGVAVDGTTSNAPAKLTGAQILAIYKGTTTNWSDVGGSNGTIKPYIPQSGSGTRSFFDAQLTALNGGTAITYGANVDDTMHENTDDVLKNDANAIAPFSLGKQQTLFPSTVKMEGLNNANGGWSAQRALYNVVRQADLANSHIQAIFGEDGFICSTAARPLIEAAGFQQLATSGHGGVCGSATQAPTSNFTLNEQVATTTKLTAKTTKPGKASLTATVSGSSAPSGTVDFYEGTTLLQAGVPMVSGQASYNASGSVGSHSYTAKFVPADGSQFDASEGSKTVSIKAKSSISESFPATVKKGKRASGTVTVKLTGASDKATGSVKVKEGKKVLAKGKLKNGKVAFTLPALKKGKHTLKAVWAGDGNGVAADKSFTITQK